MIDLDEKLELARSKAKHYGELRGRKEVADDRLKLIFSELFCDAPDGTVDFKTAWAKNHFDYRAAVDDKEVAFSEWTAAEAYMKILFAEVEKYRTDQATNRTIDRMHT